MADDSYEDAAADGLVYNLTKVKIAPYENAGAVDHKVHCQIAKEPQSRGAQYKCEVFRTFD